jgi:hypothetical protein
VGFADRVGDDDEEQSEVECTENQGHATNSRGSHQYGKRTATLNNSELIHHLQSVNTEPLLDTTFM